MLFTILPRSAKLTVLLFSITFTRHSVSIVSMERMSYFFDMPTPLLPLPIAIVFEHLTILIIWRFKMFQWSTMIPDREPRYKLRATKVHIFISPEPACAGELLRCFIPLFWPKSAGILPVSGMARELYGAGIISHRQSGCEQALLEAESIQVYDHDQL